MNLGQRFPDRQVGSNAEPLSVQLVRYSVPIDFTDATVTFVMVDAISGDVVQLAGVASGAMNGVVQFAPAAADLATPGLYRCQFVASWTNGTVHRSEMIALRLLPNG